MIAVSTCRLPTAPSSDKNCRCVNGRGLQTAHIAGPFGVFALPSAVDNGIHAALHVLACGHPRRYADTHCGLPLPPSSAAPTGSIRLNFVNHCLSGRVISEGHEDLV